LEYSAGPTIVSYQYLLFCLRNSDLDWNANRFQRLTKGLFTTHCQSLFGYGTSSNVAWPWWYLDPYLRRYVCHLYPLWNCCLQLQRGVVDRVSAA
jgi:hypothetical protein